MLWVGTYAAKGGKGLYPIERSKGSLDVGTPEANIANASFGVWCARNRTAYFVDEQEAGRVTAWRRDAGLWQEIGVSGTGGALPCYVSISPDRRYLAVANYGDGSVALINIEPDNGRIAGLVDIARASGRGKDPGRQTGPHAHCALFSEDGQALYHVDLGLDHVLIYDLVDGRMERRGVAFVAPEGSGPRHLVLHPDRTHALLLCELSAELFLLRRRRGGFEVSDALKTAPEAGNPENLGGHLAIASDGSVLVTNRGHDSIAAFAIAGDRLAARGWKHTGGSSPRHFHLDGAQAIVAHEESGSISLLAVPSQQGSAGPLATAQLPGAAFVIDIPE